MEEDPGSEPRIVSEEPSVEKEEKRDKKGLLAALFRFGGSKGAGAAFATGGTGAGAGAGFPGLSALLATRAGVVGLVLVAGGVAAGIGLVGKAFFGGPSDIGGSSSIFATRAPGSSADSGAAGAADKASAEGVSSSLQFFTDANNKTDVEPGAASGRTGDTGASDSEATEGGEGGEGADNENAPGMGAAATFEGKQVGKLSSALGKGGAGATSSAMSKTSMPSLKTKGATGQAAAMRRGSRKGIFGGKRGARALGSDSVMQARLVGRDHVGTPSSPESGRTYDGGAAVIGGAPGGDGVPLGGQGQNTDSPDGNPPLNQPGTGDLPPAAKAPDSIAGGDVTPWQDAIDRILTNLAIAFGLLFAISKIVPWLAGIPGWEPSIMAIKIALTAMAVAAIALAVQALAIATDVVRGEYAQDLQGNIGIYGGAFMALMGGVAIYAIWKGNPKNVAKLNESFSGGMGVFFKVAGIAALAAIGYGFLSEPKKYPAEEFINRDVPDARHVPSVEGPRELYARAPGRVYRSERVLD